MKSVSSVARSVSIRTSKSQHSVPDLSDEVEDSDYDMESKGALHSSNVGDSHGAALFKKVSRDMKKKGGVPMKRAVHTFMVNHVERCIARQEDVVTRSKKVIEKAEAVRVEMDEILGELKNVEITD